MTEKQLALFRGLPVLRGPRPKPTTAQWSLLLLLMLPRQRWPRPLCGHEKPMLRRLIADGLVKVTGDLVDRYQVTERGRDFCRGY